MIRNFIVMGTNSQTAYRQCVEAGPGAKLDRILDIYRNEAGSASSLQFLDTTTNHQYTKWAQTLISQRREEKKISINYRTKEDTTRMPDPQAQRNRYKHNSGRACHWCGNSHKPQECPAYSKQCLNCGIMNHYARVCNKRRSPRSSPNMPSFNVKRPQSPRNNQFRYQNGSSINKLEPQFNQMTVNSKS